MTLSVIVLAAGRGQRMCSKRPKVLHSVAGIPMLARILTTVSGLNPEQTVVVCNHEQQSVFEAIVPAPNAVIWARQEEPLGTGHAVLQALPHVKTDRVLVLYGDISLIQTNTLQKLLLLNKQQVGLVSMNVADPFELGRLVRDAKGKLLRIVEEKEASEENKQIHEINAGFFVAPRELLERWLTEIVETSQQKEYYLTDIVAKACAENQIVNTVSAEFEWEITGVNTKKQLAELERCFQAAQAEKLMEKGVSLLDPARFDQRGEVRVGQDVTIDVNVILEGSVVLGDNVSIGPNVYLKNTQIDAGAQILANSVVDGAHIGADCRIGPFARIRPGSVVEEKAQIGNFVETKNTKLGVQSKANHLSYLGDAVIGSGVNIGAGTITCNYDGHQKHKTVIEADAFIGAGTQLIAPVTIGKGSIVGSGTTVTRDVPAGQLIHNAIKHRIVPAEEKEA